MDLYALPPEEFTAARNVAAKQDKALKALRKPTVSAWVVNTLVRREAALLEQLLSLGHDLGLAQQQGDAAALRTLSDQRRQLVGTVSQRAVELVERDITAAVRLEVESTLEAALADPASADAVRSGQLVRALSFAGFGGVDLEGAVADVPTVSIGKGAPTKAGKPKPSGKAEKGKVKPSSSRGADQEGQPAEAGTSKKVQRLEAAALDAHGALDDAVRQAERVVHDLGQAEADEQENQAAVDTADGAVKKARAALAVAEQHRDAASSRRIKGTKAADELRRKAERATRAVATAQAAADDARTALDAARRS